ncbi:pyridoxamine 5'-phosphate oxidase family protein [Coprothermobacter platensis]|uniref:pyridoxamine 5'-phosphate oxidase family protein n=1 Tax=Coprothermobacter platensis TaxID=108819 RepID=UPI000379E6D7|nr:pyridoxamine 5'-phosphate oxidase family protein [Coprothermobacter platensis]
MRRIDREVTDPARIDEIIRICDCCRLGMVDKDSVYIVPLNFGFKNENGKRIFYFHGAKEGKKMELVKLNPLVGFEMDTNHRISVGKNACDYSFLYSSVIGKGVVTLVEDVQEKRNALNLIMQHYSGRNNWTFHPEALEKIAVMKLEVTELSCKEHV